MRLVTKGLGCVIYLKPFDNLAEMERDNRCADEEAYKPQPFSTTKIDEHCWMQILATIDVSAMSRGIEFYDKLGYEVIPIRTIQVRHGQDSKIEPINWVKTEITLSDASDCEEAECIQARKPR